MGYMAEDRHTRRRGFGTANGCLFLTIDGSLDSAYDKDSRTISLTLLPPLFHAQTYRRC